VYCNDYVEYKKTHQCLSDCGLAGAFASALDLNVILELLDYYYDITPDPTNSLDTRMPQ
jgi:hypothetical protein